MMLTYWPRPNFLGDSFAQVEPSDGGAALRILHSAFQFDVISDPASVSGALSAGCGCLGCMLSARAETALKAAALSGSSAGPPSGIGGHSGAAETPQFLGDDIGDNTSSTATISVGGTLTSSIQSSGDLDYVRVTLTAGQTYTFSLAATAGGLSDAYLELRTAADTLVAENDDGGILLNSFLMFTPTTSGDYFIVARAFSTETGGYTLGVEAIDTGETSPTAFPNNGLTHFSWEEAAIQISRTGASWSNTFGTAAVVTYSYRSTAPTTMPDDTAGFTRFNAAQIAATEAALAAWAAVANITFVRVNDGDGYSNNASIVFGNYSSGADGAAAFAYLPSSGSTSSTSAQGDVWVNSTLSYNSNPTAGGYGPQVLLHEIGHALGLSHPGDYNAGQGSPSYPDSVDYFADTRMFTTMSYFGSINTGGVLPYYASLPQLHDIAAIQRLYGANMATRTGDTIYGFNSNTGVAEYTLTLASQGATFAIWDGGGLDTLDLSGYSQNAIIDLREEAFSSAGPGLPGLAVFNISIARGAVIENAIGGSGADTLIGNAANNVLNGGAGADAMSGGLGDDQYMVDNAGDVVTEASGQGRDTVYTTITYTLGANIEDLATATSNAVNLYGNALDNLIVGNGAINTLDGGAGADTLIGGGGNDLYLIDNIADVIIEGAGEGTADVVYTSLAYYQMGDNVEQGSITGTGGSYLIGNSVANLLVGNSGADTLDGGAGADTLVGGAGNDLYFVDNIADVIIEGAGQGTADVVYTSLAYYQMGDNVEQGSITGTGGSYLIGNSVANLLVGNSGADTLDGGAGADTLVGGAGNDLYFVDDIADVIIEGAGEGTADVVYTSLAYYALGDNVEQLSVTSASGTYAVGNSIANLIVGNAGGDALEGRGGGDVLVGGGGGDYFIYNSASEGGDAIVDFVSGVDFIRIDASGFGGGLIAGGAVTLISGSTPTAGGGAAFLYDTDDGRLYWDSDGAGGADPILLATLSGAPTLTQSDFVIVP